MIRKCNLNDLEDLINLRMGIQNYDTRYFNKNDIVLEEDGLIENTRNYLINNLNKNLFLFGCFVNDKLVSVCGFYLERHFPTYINPCGISAYICNVFTKEDYRRKGYQRQVFEYCLNFAKSMKIRRFKLDSKNEIAIKFYKSYGFEKHEDIYYLNI